MRYTTITTNEFVTKLFAGEREFNNIKLENADLAGHEAYSELQEYLLNQDLKAEPILLQNAQLERLHAPTLYLPFTNLTRANLTLAYLTEANLEEADLTRANLEEADLTRANLCGVEGLETTCDLSTITCKQIRITSKEARILSNALFNIVQE